MFVASGLFSSLLLVSLAAGSGQRPAPPARKKPTPATPQTAPAAVSPAATSPRGDPVDGKFTTTEGLARVRALYQALEYDQVIPLTEVLLARDDLQVDDRLDVYRLQGSARAIVEDPVDAEKPFRLLLRTRSDYELPPETPPKILAVFRKVQSEERALAGQLREVERARIIANLRLNGEVPAEIRGGKTLPFSFRLKDPTGSVEAIRVPYRRAGQPAFSSLALGRGESGDWTGQISGEFTSDEKGFKLEYYIETSDASGPLLTLGTSLMPRAVAVTPGLFTTDRPKPLPRGLFVGGAVATAVLGATAGTLGFLFNRQQASYRAMSSGGGDVAGSSLAAQARLGNTLGTATNVAIISTGVLLVATLVSLPLTRFDGP